MERRSSCPLPWQDQGLHDRPVRRRATGDRDRCPYPQDSPDHTAVELVTVGGGRGCSRCSARKGPGRCRNGTDHGLGLQFSVERSITAIQVGHGRSDTEPSIRPHDEPRVSRTLAGFATTGTRSQIQPSEYCVATMEGRPERPGREPMNATAMKLLDSNLLLGALVGKTVSASVWDALDKFWSEDAERAPTPVRPQRCVPVSQRTQRQAPQPVRQRHRSASVESWSPSSSWVPPWQDKATLCMFLCLSENTVDTWVRQGMLPPPRKRGGKLMWKWSEVEKYLEGNDPQSPEDLAEGIRNATRRAAKGE